MNGFLYSQYRANLCRGYDKDKHKTTTAKERDLHRFERIFYFWPMYAWVLIQAKSRYRQKTTQTVETPEGVFFNAESETT